MKAGQSNALSKKRFRVVEFRETTSSALATWKSIKLAAMKEDFALSEAGTKSAIGKAEMRLVAYLVASGSGIGKWMAVLMCLQTIVIVAGIYGIFYFHFR